LRVADEAEAEALDAGIGIRDLRNTSEAGGVDTQPLPVPVLLLFVTS
jgi:hypothetical protein